MPKDVWKEYEANTLSHSAAHYLTTIHQLLREHGYARVTDIAKHLNITRGSCSISLKALKKRGLVVEDENKFLQLSNEGERLAELVEKNDQVIEDFLKGVLGVKAEQAEIDACKLEHLLSRDSSMRLASFLQFVSSDAPVAREFMREYRSNGPTCPHDAEKCQICEATCLVEAAPKTARLKA